MQREWLRKFMYADGLKFEYILEEIHWYGWYSNWYKWN
jgi:hypothetical protein